MLEQKVISNSDRRYETMKQILLPLTLFFLTLAGCGETVTRGNSSRILTMGDSLFAWHGVSGRSVSDSIEMILGEQVIDRSVAGARIMYGLPISGAMGLKIEKQYTSGSWEWIVLNGGGNDLLFGCGCSLCDNKVDRLVSHSGRNGKIPKLVSELRNTGARIIYVGYLRSPGVGSPIESCKSAGNELERRIEKMAMVDEGVYFLSLSEMVPYGDTTFHGMDMVHPSIKGSREIGMRIADIIKQRPYLFGG